MPRTRSLINTALCWNTRACNNKPTMYLLLLFAGTPEPVIINQPCIYFCTENKKKAENEIQHTVSYY